MDSRSEFKLRLEKKGILFETDKLIWLPDISQFPHLLVLQISSTILFISWLTRDFVAKARFMIKSNYQIAITNTVTKTHFCSCFCLRVLFWLIVGSIRGSIESKFVKVWGETGMRWVGCGGRGAFEMVGN